MRITQRLKVRARAAARKTRKHARARGYALARAAAGATPPRLRARILKVARTAQSQPRPQLRVRVRGLAPTGPRAVYARILDGEHLWIAVPADAGRPALWDPATQTVIDAPNNLPADHVEHDPAYVSVRWRLTDVVPEEDKATLLTVVVPAAGGRPRPLRRPRPAPPPSSLRTPTTPDGRWQFALNDAKDGVLCVRRERVAMVRLLAVEVAETTVSLSFTSSQEGPLQLLFVKAGGIKHSVPTERIGDRIIARLDAESMPEFGVYRVALGTPASHVQVSRQRNDLAITDWSTVLMPEVLAPDRSRVVAALQFTKAGLLQLTRRTAEEPTELKASA